MRTAKDFPRSIVPGGLVSPITRRIVFVLSYELIAMVLTTLGLTVLGFGSGRSGLLAVVASVVAMVWNYVYNTVFEWWERRGHSLHRTLRRRIAHAAGFEVGLVILFIPIVAITLQVPLSEAFGLEIGLLVFFLVYTFVYTWLFDIVWPARARPANPAGR